MLQVKGLNLGFNFENSIKQVLFDVSFDLQKGKTLALVGESGCGKTMSAMSILNLLPKNSVIMSGEVLFNNENLLTYNQKKYAKYSWS